MSDVSQPVWLWDAEVQRAIDKSSTEAVVGTDGSGRIIKWSLATERLFGWRSSEVLGEAMPALIVPRRYRAAYRGAVAGVLRSRQSPGTRNASLEIVAVRRDGRELPVEVSVTGALVRGQMWVKTTMRDATLRKALESSLRQQALADPLTGLPNRTLLFDRLASAIARLDRRSGSIAALFVDLDRFKVVNDGLGHKAGDQALIVIADRIRSALRGSDTVARYGGDEFVVLCEDLANPEMASVLAERICAAIRAPIQLVERSVVVTASIGVAVAESGSFGDDLLTDADRAGYQVKQSGGNGHAVFVASTRRRGVARLDAEIDLRAAIDRSELRLLYQPMIDLRTGRIAGTEALLRWEHPRRGTIAPLDFIPLAEETGLIIAIGAWVLDTACAQQRRWTESLGALAPQVVSVNLSGRQLGTGHLGKDVANALDNNNLEPSHLCLEITESVMMDDALSTLDSLGEMRDLGVRLSVDDFGTGYSSLLYLRRLPVSELKIDRLFIAGLGRNPEDTAIVEGIISLGHGLNMSVVAEGVETADQLGSLRHLGADRAQGYYWSRPISAEDLHDVFTTKQGAPEPTERIDGPMLHPSSEPSRQLDPPVHALGTYRVLLIDDARPERELLRIWLDESAHFVVVAEADNGPQGVHLAAHHLPDVVVLDMSMPGMSGMEALSRVQTVSPHSKVVVVSGFLSPGLVQAVIDQGASACLDKSVGPQRLIELILDTADHMRRVVA